MKAYLGTWDVSDRLQIRKATFVRSGLEIDLTRIIDEAGSLAFEDADGAVAQYIQENMPLVKITDDSGATLFAGYPKDVIRHRGWTEIRLTSAVLRDQKIQDVEAGEYSPGNPNYIKAGVYSLKDILLQLFPDSREDEIDEIEIDSTDSAYFLKPTLRRFPQSSRTDEDYRSQDKYTCAGFYTRGAGTGHILHYRDGFIWDFQESGGTIYLQHRLDLGRRISTFADDEYPAVRVLHIDDDYDTVRFVATNGTKLVLGKWKISGDILDTIEAVVERATDYTTFQTATGDEIWQAFWTAAYNPDDSKYYYVVASRQDDSVFYAVQTYTADLATRARYANKLTGTRPYPLDAGVIYYDSGASAYKYIVGNTAQNLTCVIPLPYSGGSLSTKSGAYLIKDAAAALDPSTNDAKVTARHLTNGNLVYWNPSTDTVSEDLGFQGLTSEPYAVLKSHPHGGLIGITAKESNAKYYRLRTDQYTTSGTATHNATVFAEGLVGFFAPWDNADYRAIGSLFGAPFIGELVWQKEYPKVILRYEDIDKPAKDLLEEVIRLGVYAIQYTGNGRAIRAKSMLIAPSTDPAEIAARIHARAHLLPVAEIKNETELQIGDYSPVEGSDRGQIQTWRWTFVTDYDARILAEWYLDLIDKHPAGIDFETPDRLQVGDYVRLQDYDGTTYTGRIVSETVLETTYRYQMLASVDWTTLSLDTPAPQLAVPSAPDLAVEITPLFPGTFGFLRIRVTGTNEGGLAKRVKVYITEWPEIQSTGSAYRTTLVLDQQIGGAFDVQFAYLSRYTSLILAEAVLENDSGESPQRARAFYYSTTPPQLGEVYAKDGKATVQSAGDGLRYVIAQNINSVLNDDDGDGLPDLWTLEYTEDGGVTWTKIESTDDIPSWVSITYGIQPVIGKTDLKIWITVNDTNKAIRLVSPQIPYNPDLQEHFVEIYYKIPDTGGGTHNGECDVMALTYDRDGNVVDDWVSLGSISASDGTSGKWTKKVPAAYFSSTARFIAIGLYFYGSFSTGNAFELSAAGLRRADFDYLIRETTPVADSDVTNKQYVDNRDPYAHETNTLPTCDAANYGRIIIYDYVDGSTHYNKVLVCKKTGETTYAWCTICENSWVEAEP